MLVHGDDFVASGERSKILKFQKQLAKRFTIKHKVVGSGGQVTSRSKAASSSFSGLAAIDTSGKELKEARILNRVVRWTTEGWEYEADQRHAELIVKAMGLEKARPVTSPGEEEPAWKLEDNEKPLSVSEATHYRMVAARANYLATDRTDIQFATKECCRGMATPQVQHLSSLKRLARYLLGKPRMIWKYAWQTPENLTVYSDSDWAGCKRTARSTSSGIIMRGQHHVKSWSITQKRVTLSSAEAELGALVKASAEAIGIVQMAEGLGDKVSAEVYVDSSAALSVTQRKGTGKMRHVRIGQLWVQEAAEQGELSYKKVKGTGNPADLGTKHLTAKKIE